MDMVLDVEKKKGPGYRWGQSNVAQFLPKGESKFREEVTERETQERYSDATGIIEPEYWLVLLYYTQHYRNENLNVWDLLPGLCAANMGGKVRLGREGHSGKAPSLTTAHTQPSSGSQM